MLGFDHLGGVYEMGLEAKTFIKGLRKGRCANKGSDLKKDVKDNEFWSHEEKQ